MSQTEYGAQADISKASQVSYETGISCPDAVYLQQMVQTAGLDLSYVVLGVPANVQAGRDMDWDLLADLIDVIRAFERQRGSELTGALFSRFLRILYASTIATGKVDPGVVEAVFATAA